MSTQSGSINMDQESQARAVSRKFWVMSLCFGVMHACVTVPVAFSTAYLQGRNGSTANGTLYFTTIFSSLFLSTPLCSGLFPGRPTKPLQFGSTFYAAYVILFGVAVALHDDENKQKLVCILGALLGGIGAGVLWTAQGVYFSNAAKRLAYLRGEEAAHVTSRFAGFFSVVYLVTEVIFKFASTPLLAALGQGPNQYRNCGIVFAAYGGLSLLMMVGFGINGDVQMYDDDEKEPEREPVSVSMITGKVLKAVSLWTDSRVWLLCFTNLTFGVAVTFLNGFVNQNITSNELSKDIIGAFQGGTSCIAALFSFLYGFSKTPVLPLSIATLVFALMPILVYFDVVHKWGLVTLYLLQGIGRAVYESTNRAIFGQVFKKNPDGAFANLMMQSCTVTAFFFLFGGVATTVSQEAYGHSMELAMLIFAALIVPCYLLAKRKTDILAEEEQALLG